MPLQPQRLGLRRLARALSTLLHSFTMDKLHCSRLWHCDIATRMRSISIFIFDNSAASTTTTAARHYCARRRRTRVFCVRSQAQKFQGTNARPLSTFICRCSLLQDYFCFCSLPFYYLIVHSHDVSFLFGSSRLITTTGAPWRPRRGPRPLLDPGGLAG
jgi:hypothetical protein